VFEVKNLTVERGRFNLRVDRLFLKKGEHLSIVGPSGSGKTTFLETVAGKIKPKSGRIVLDGKRLCNLPPERRGVSVVYQDYLLFPHLGVFENVAFALRKKIKDAAALRREVLKLAGRLGIEHLLERPVGALSGGEKQRVALARALAARPRLLLLDEPFSALDPQTSERLRLEVLKICSELSISAILVTHRLEEALSFGDRVALLKEGRLVEENDPKSFFFNPQKIETALFVGFNVLKGKVVQTEGGAAVEVCGALLKTPPVPKGTGGMVFVAFRPEFVTLGGGENALEVEVESVRAEGFFVTLFLKRGGCGFRAKVPAEGAPRAGERITVGIDPSRIVIKIPRL